MELQKMKRATESDVRCHRETREVHATYSFIQEGT
jgi:hypothetical protein